MNSVKKIRQRRTFTFTAYDWNICYAGIHLGTLPIVILEEFNVPLLERFDVRFMVTITAADEGQYLLRVLLLIRPRYYSLYKITNKVGKLKFLGSICKNKFRRLYPIVDSVDFRCDIKVERLI